jgi:hypothetical protein
MAPDLAFDIQFIHIIHTIIIIFTDLFTQLLYTFWLKLPFDWRSPLISALSLCFSGKLSQHKNYEN